MRYISILSFNKNDKQNEFEINIFNIIDMIYFHMSMGQEAIPRKNSSPDCCSGCNQPRLLACGGIHDRPCLLALLPARSLYPSRLRSQNQLLCIQLVFHSQLSQHSPRNERLLWLTNEMHRHLFLEL